MVKSIAERLKAKKVLSTASAHYDYALAVYGVPCHEIKMRLLAVIGIVYFILTT